MQLSTGLGYKCVSQLTTWAYCAADANDNTECCRNKGDIKFQKILFFHIFLLMVFNHGFYCSWILYILYEIEYNFFRTNYHLHILTNFLGVHKDCLSFCKGDVPTCDLQSILSYQPCLKDIENIIKCQVSDKENLKNSFFGSTVSYETNHLWKINLNNRQISFSTGLGSPKWCRKNLWTLKCNIF